MEHAWGRVGMGNPVAAGGAKFRMVGFDGGLGQSTSLARPLLRLCCECRTTGGETVHDTTDPHWHEPEGLKNAGYGAWKRPNTPYDDYMEAQGIPVYRGIGVRRVQDMPLKRWNRMGGNGTFTQLYGTEGRWGCYVVEVPGAGALNAERHMYEEIMVVVEGRGTTEIWTDDQKKPHSFEWQRGSMFAVPLNAWHRIVNAASSPALILVASTAP